MKPGFFLVFLSLLFLSSGGCSVEESGQPKTISGLKSDFVDLRFGMFICYNIMSYGADWGQADYPISSFNPSELDCKQWADAALSARMKFGLLTTKHHEGFCLWDSEFTDYDVASTPYKKDIVKQYVDVLTLVPAHRVKPAPEVALAEGNITACSVSVSRNNREFEVVAEQSWEANALYRSIGFERQAARYLKIDIHEAKGPSAIITELEVGLSD